MKFLSFIPNRISCVKNQRKVTIPNSTVLNISFCFKFSATLISRRLCWKFKRDSGQIEWIWCGASLIVSKILVRTLKPFYNFTSRCSVKNILSNQYQLTIYFCKRDEFNEFFGSLGLRNVEKYKRDFGQKKSWNHIFSNFFSNKNVDLTEKFVKSTLVSHHSGNYGNSLKHF